MKRAGIALVVSVPLLIACIEPVQYGGPIPVDARGVEARLVRVCTISPQSVCGSLGEDDAGEGTEAGN